MIQKQRSESARLKTFQYQRMGMCMYSHSHILKKRGWKLSRENATDKIDVGFRMVSFVKSWYGLVGG